MQPINLALHDFETFVEADILDDKHASLIIISGSNRFEESRVSIGTRIKMLKEKVEALNVKTNATT